MGEHPKSHPPARYVVLIANDGDLKNAVGDAKLVEKALLNCGLCKKEQLWPIYDQPGRGLSAVIVS